MATSRGFLGAVLAFALSSGIVSAQTTGKTVRHHKEAVVDQSSPELAQAESAIDKKDYTSAEPLLKKVVERTPSDYQAWFDLGFVYNALGRSEDSIAAYRTFSNRI